GGAADHAVPGAIRGRENVTDEWQQHLPGPPIPGALHAGPGSVLPLSQSGCLHFEGTGRALETANPVRLQKGEQASGAGRHPRIDRRTGLLPGTYHPRVASLYLLSTALAG